NNQKFSSAIAKIISNFRKESLNYLTLPNKRNLVTVDKNLSHSYFSLSFQVENFSQKRISKFSRRWIEKNNYKEALFYSGNKLHIYAEKAKNSKLLIDFHTDFERYQNQINTLDSLKNQVSNILLSYDLQESHIKISEDIENPKLRVTLAFQKNEEEFKTIELSVNTDIDTFKKELKTFGLETKNQPSHINLINPFGGSSIQKRKIEKPVEKTPEKKEKIQAPVSTVSKINWGKFSYPPAKDGPEIRPIINKNSNDQHRFFAKFSLTKGDVHSESVFKNFQSVFEEENIVCGKGQKGYKFFETISIMIDGKSKSMPVRKMKILGKKTAGLRLYPSKALVRQDGKILFDYNKVCTHDEKPPQIKVTYCK
ncbi:MAG: hypothetical protein AAGG80_05640, partial [Pseudomonadota bacterium]